MKNWKTTSRFCDSSSSCRLLSSCYFSSQSPWWGRFDFQPGVFLLLFLHPRGLEFYYGHLLTNRNRAFCSNLEALLEPILGHFCIHKPLFLDISAVATFTSRVRCRNTLGFSYKLFPSLLRSLRYAWVYIQHSASSGIDIHLFKELSGTFYHITRRTLQPQTFLNFPAF